MLQNGLIASLFVLFWVESGKYQSKMHGKLMHLEKQWKQLR